MNKRVISLILIVTFILGIGTGAFGATNIEEIKAFLNHDIKIKLNGRDFEPREASGERMLPIIYKSRSYLPVRAVAEAVGLAVDYDANTKTVYLGERGKIVILEDDFMNMWSSQYSTDKADLSVNNKTFDYGVVFNGNNEYAEFSFFINPQGKYQKFGGTLCFQEDDASTEDIIVKIRDNDHNGTVLKELKVTKNHNVDFEIDIANIKTLYIQNLIYDRNPKNTKPDKLILAEPYFK